MELFEVIEDGHRWLGSRNFHTDPARLEDFFDRLEGEAKALFDRVCAELPCPKEHLAAKWDDYGWDPCILHEGTLFKPARLKRPIPFYEKHWCCFENSFAFAEKYDYSYVEGIAINPSGIQIHAWVTTDGEDVLDYTWPLQHVNKYFGVPLNIEYLKGKGVTQGGLLAHVTKWHQEKKQKDSA